MNALDHHILEILEEKDVTERIIEEWGDEDWITSKRWIETTLIIDCEGRIEKTTQLFNDSMWETVKEERNYLG